MFGNVSARFRAVLKGTVSAAGAAVREALRRTPIVTGFVADLFRSRDELLAENALLRQQLIVAARKVKQPEFRPLERGLLLALSSAVKNWQNAILLVKSDTVLRWHREGFRLPWKRKSKATKHVEAPLMNSTCERFIGSARRECLDHVIILSEAHLRAVLEEWVGHFNGGRPHQGIEQRAPVPSAGSSAAEAGNVVALPVLGGLHHDYRRAA